MEQKEIENRIRDIILEYSDKGKHKADLIVEIVNEALTEAYNNGVRDAAECVRPLSETAAEDIIKLYSKPLS